MPSPTQDPYSLSKQSRYYFLGYGENLMSKSLYINDLIPMITLSDFQKKSISNLLSDIDNKILKLKFNNCLCKNQNVGNDIIISEKDRYGIPVKNLICSKLPKISQSLKGVPFGLDWLK